MTTLDMLQAAIRIRGASDENFSPRMIYDTFVYHCGELWDAREKERMCGETTKTLRDRQTSAIGQLIVSLLALTTALGERAEEVVTAAFNTKTQQLFGHDASVRDVTLPLTAVQQSTSRRSSPFSDYVPTGGQ